MGFPSENLVRSVRYSRCKSTLDAEFVAEGEAEVTKMGVEVDPLRESGTAGRASEQLNTEKKERNRRTNGIAFRIGSICAKSPM